MGSSSTTRFVDVSCGLLAQGYGVRFRASGASMRPAVCDGDVITVAPSAASSVAPGTVLLYRRDGRLFAHRVVHVSNGAGGLLLRGDALPSCDAPVDPALVVGELVAVRRARAGCAHFTALALRLLRRVRRMSAAVLAN
jgi:hypothetical protein